MPLRDARVHLSQSMQSICAQSLENFELIVVDDGSTDDSPQFVEQCAQHDARIRLFRRPARGIVAALNYGLAQARSNYIARMDADDIMHPQRLATQLDYMQARAELSLLACCVHAFPDSAMGAGMREYMRWQNACIDEQQIHQQLYIESVFTHPSVMFRRDRIVALGGYRDGDFPEDYELWLRLAAAGEAMAKLPQVLLNWRQHEHSLSRHDARYSRAAFDRLRAQYLAQDSRLDCARDIVIWGAGRRTRKRCEHFFSHGHRVTAWIDIDPRKIGQHYGGVPVYGKDWLAQDSLLSQRPYVLVYVTNHGAREEIAEDLHALGYCVGRDYLMIG